MRADDFCGYPFTPQEPIPEVLLTLASVEKSVRLQGRIDLMEALDDVCISCIRADGSLDGPASIAALEAVIAKIAVERASDSDGSLTE